MTSKSKRKDKRSASKTTGTGAPDTSVETITKAPLGASAHAVREDALDISTKAISHHPFEVPADAVSEDTPGRSTETISHDPLDAPADAVSENDPGASAVMMSGCAKTDELHEKVLTPSTNFKAQGSVVFQNLFQEWFKFAGMRMHQHLHLIQAIQECRSLPDLQQAYSQFWQNACTQYGEETQRMMLITQGAVHGASRVTHQNGAEQATLH